MRFRFDVVSVLPSKTHLLVHTIYEAPWFRTAVTQAYRTKKDPEGVTVAFVQMALSTPQIPRSIRWFLRQVGSAA